MNLHKHPKIYSSLITLGVFVLLMTPGLVLAQSDGVGEGGITNFIQEQVWKFLTMVGGFLVWLGGKMLNYAVTYYVVGFGDFYLSSGLGDSVNSLWSIVRDVFNLTFIFGLVFIGFKLIFGDGSAKRALGTLIMAALLVNFSLFITKFVIDFSNIAAAQFANAFLVGTQYNVSDGFMRLFGLNGIFSTGNDLPATAGWTYIFLTFLLFIVSAFVFIAGGLLLIIRFVVLNIYMILSPIMFLGWVFPGFSGTSRSYWNGFLQRAFFAPAYLLMLYMSHQVLVNMRLSNGSSQKLGAVATSNSRAADTAFDQTIPLFLVSIIFLIASLMVAQKMGAQGATSAIAIGKRLTGKAKQVATRTALGAAGAATYLPKAGARMGVNKIGTKLEKSLNNLQTKSGVWGSVAKTNAADRFVRGTANNMKNAELGTGTTNDKESEYKAKTISRANQTAAENKRGQDFDNNIKALSDSTKSASDLKDALNDLGKVIKGMSKDEKNSIKLSDLTNRSVAIHLSDDDIKNLDSSGKFSAAEIQQVKDARKDGFVSMAAGGSTLANVNSSGVVTGYNTTNPNASAVDTRSSIAGKSVKEVGNMPIEVFKQPSMYNYITPSMLEERIKNGMSPADMSAVKSSLYTHLRVPTGSSLGSILTNDNPWVKWEGGNSVHAAQFFA